jgi:hypothetical protein
MHSPLTHSLQAKLPERKKATQMQSLPRPPEDELMASCFRFCARTSNTRICVLLGAVLFQTQTHSLIQRSTAPIINDNLMNTPWRSLRINEQSQTRARCAARGAPM